MREEVSKAALSYSFINRYKKNIKKKVRKYEHVVVALAYYKNITSDVIRVSQAFDKGVDSEFNVYLEYNRISGYMNLTLRKTIVW